MFCTLISTSKEEFSAICLKSLIGTCLQHHHLVKTFSGVLSRSVAAVIHRVILQEKTIHHCCCWNFILPARLLTATYQTHNNVEKLSKMFGSFHNVSNVVHEKKYYWKKIAMKMLYLYFISLLPLDGASLVKH